jgi:hypothetical protein
MPLSDLMISVNYEIQAPVDMRGLNCKIPGFILSQVVCEQEAAVAPWKKFGKVLQLQPLSFWAHMKLI